ncbi:hypothetical protein ACT4UT_12175, partial [Bacillus sp. B-TM1]
MKRFITHANGDKIFKKLVLMVLPMVLMIMMITPSNGALAADQSNTGSLKGVSLFNGSWTVAIQAANLQYVSAEPSGNVVANVYNSPVGINSNFSHSLTALRFAT